MLGRAMNGMEVGGRGNNIMEWKAGIEYWSNRFIMDPFCIIIGGIVYQKAKWTLKPALILAIIWIMVNVMMPDCMYIQALLFS